MMFGFILCAFALVVLAMAVLLKPLATRMRLLPMLAVTVIVAGMVGALYMIVGTPAALNPRLSQPATNMTDAIAQLEARVASTPTDRTALTLLAQAYASTGKHNLVEPTLAKAIAADPANADTYAQAAEILIAASNDRAISDTAFGYLKHAVSLNTNQQRARWFLGIAQRQRGDDKGAIETWTTLLPMVDRSAGEALLIEVNDARGNIGLPPLSTSVLKAVPAESIRVAVSLRDALRQQLSPDAVVFITAKAVNGGGMPLAAKRYALADLPSTIFLSDMDSPMPTARLSEQKQVVVSAKISLTGNANSDPSDLVSTERTVKPGDSSITTLTFGGSP